MTERVQHLKEHLDTLSDDAIFGERARLLLEAEGQCRNAGNGEKYVQCFSHLLKHMTVFIQREELIVGSIQEELLDENEEAQFAALCDRYNFMATELFTFDPLKIIEITDPDERFAPEWFNSYGHCIPDWERVLGLGFTGIAQEARSRLEQGGLLPKQEEFLMNAIQAAEAVNTYIERYAILAEKEAADATDEAERQRLRQIGQVCQQLATGGARTFREAVQLLWFGMLILQAVCGARDYAYGRLDQYLFPYYAADVDAGRITQEEALELLECMFIKTNEIIGYGWEAYRPKRVLCVNSLQYVILSGMDEAGRDMTNPISWLALEAVNELKLKQPTVNIRYHENIDRDFLERAMEITASGLGYPSYFNDHVVIPALRNNGVDEKDAYDYAYYGCNNSFLPGHEDELREAWHCGPKYLEYALNSGACMLTGKVQGVATPSPHKLNNMDDIYDALRIQMADGIRKAVAHVEQSDRYWAEKKPFSFESILMTDCIQRASSMNEEGSLQKHINNHFCGLATLANSLYAIKRLVFQEKRLTLPELVELLKSNWAGEEALRNTVKEKYPKFGNDDDVVDGIAAKIVAIFVEELKKASPTATNRKLYPSVYSLWHHRAFGEKCAASADGRLAGEEISESQSPVYGTEANGPTAMFNSVAKLPFDETPSGGMNVKFQPRLFKGEGGAQNLTALLEGYFARGGMHAQVNVIGRETLEDAMAHPEKHKNLLVRVVGYSAYFVSLSPEQQRELIERTEL